MLNVSGTRDIRLGPPFSMEHVRLVLKCCSPGTTLVQDN
jgi:hypothetical protein